MREGKRARGSGKKGRETKEAGTEIEKRKGERGKERERGVRYLLLYFPRNVCCDFGLLSYVKMSEHTDTC